jgi:hypothetical protein
LPEVDHDRKVSAWLSARAPEATPIERAHLLVRGLGAVWDQANRSLATVTLAAIGRRVLHAGSNDHPLLTRCHVDDDGFGCDVLQDPAEDAHGEASEAARFVLIEFLRILGQLTSEVLTPSLHDALAHVHLRPTPQPGVRADGAPSTRGPKRSDDA